MRARRTITAAILATLVAAAMMAPAASAAKKKGGPVVVGTDDEGDWGTNSAAQPDPAIGSAMGMDLIEASIGMADPATLNFIIKVTELPPIGGTPEVARYIWTLSVDGERIELDGKFTNYSRGTCDPTAQSCPPPRDPGEAPFFIRGECVTDTNANLTTCKELGVVHATFDQAAGTITVPVPLELIGAKKGSVIAGLITFGDGHITAYPAAFVSREDMPADAMFMTVPYKIPKK